MGFGSFSRQVGTGAFTGFLSRYGGAKIFSKLALSAGPQGAILGASLFALAYILAPRKEPDRPDLFESQYPKTPGEVLRRDVFGHTRTGGWRYFYHTDEKQLSLTSVWVIGDGPMEGIDRIKINDRDILFSSTVRDGKATIKSPGYDGLLEVWVRAAADGTVDPVLSKLESWQGNLDGISYAVIKMTQPASREDNVDDNRWNTSFPTMEFETFGSRIDEGDSKVFTENPLRLAREYLAKHNIALSYDQDDVDYCDQQVGGGDNTTVSSIFSVSPASYSEIDWVGNSGFTKLGDNRYGFDVVNAAGRSPNTKIPTSIISFNENYNGRLLLFDYSFSTNAGVRTDTFKVFSGLEDGESVADHTLLLNHGGNILNLDFNDATEADGSLVWTFVGNKSYNNFNTWIQAALPRLSSTIDVFMGIVNSNAARIDYTAHTITETVSGSSPRYCFSTTILSDENPLEVIPSFERAMNGRIVLLPDGTARGYAGRVRQSVAVINESDCIGSPVYHVLPSPKEYFNRVSASIRVWPLYIPQDITLTDETTPN